VNVGAVGAVNASGGSVVVVVETAAVATVTANAPVVAPSAATVAPFANPAISRIAENVAFAGLLVQSYGAVALIHAPLALPPMHEQPATPLIPKVDPVIRLAVARPVRA
jgi:hypothetical protein